MLKRIIAVIAGIAVAIAVISVMEAVIGRIYPPPGWVNLRDPVALKQMTSQMPLTAFIGLLIGYALGSLAGGLVATWASGRAYPWPAVIVGTVTMLGGIMNLVEIPHPLWFVVVSQLMYLPFAWFGYLLMKRG